MSLTPVYLHQLATTLEDQERVTASEIQIAQQKALEQFTREATQAINNLAEDMINKIRGLQPVGTDRVRINIPVVGKRELSSIHAQRDDSEMKRWVESNMTDEQKTKQARKLKATKGTTHRISEKINSPRYKRLREQGFCAGMKFELVDKSRTSYGRTVFVKHIRSGRQAIINTELLETIPDGGF